MDKEGKTGKTEKEKICKNEGRETAEENRKIERDRQKDREQIITHFVWLLFSLQQCTTITLLTHSHTDRSSEGNETLFIFTMDNPALLALLGKIERKRDD